MVELRKLTKSELEELITEAIPSETKFLFSLKTNNGIEPFDFFEKYAQFKTGLISDGRPIYLAAVVRNGNRFEFWTVVNDNVKEILSLCKYAKRQLPKILATFHPLYATMEKVSPKNMKWVQWLGFKKIDENESTVTYKLGA